MEVARRILVINGKGGCGKTTIATNLAATFAAHGESIALVDNDHQASAADWVESRSADLPPIHLVPAHQMAAAYPNHALHLPMAQRASRVVIDAASVVNHGNLETLLRQADVLLIPIMPSTIDTRAVSKFVTDLLTNKAFRKQPLPVGIIANRVQPGSPAEEKLDHFLRCLDVPNVARFADLPAYCDAAEQGVGIVDIATSPAERAEVDEWERLTHWIDEQPATTTRRRANPLRAAIKERVAAQRAG